MEGLSGQLKAVVNSVGLVPGQIPGAGLPAGNVPPLVPGQIPGVVLSEQYQNPVFASQFTAYLNKIQADKAAARAAALTPIRGVNPVVGAAIGAGIGWVLLKYVL